MTSPAIATGGSCHGVADFENQLINKNCASGPKLNSQSGLITVVNFVTSCAELAQPEKTARFGTAARHCPIRAFAESAIGVTGSSEGAGHRQ